MRLLSEFAHEAVGSLTTIICNIKYTYLLYIEHFFLPNRKERENERERAMMKFKMYIY